MCFIVVQLASGGALHQESEFTSVGGAGWIHPMKSLNPLSRGPILNLAQQKF